MIKTVISHYGDLSFSIEVDQLIPELKELSRFPNGSHGMEAGFLYQYKHTNGLNDYGWEWCYSLVEREDALVKWKEGKGILRPWIYNKMKDNVWAESPYVTSLRALYIIDEDKYGPPPTVLTELDFIKIMQMATQNFTPNDLLENAKVYKNPLLSL